MDERDKVIRDHNIAMLVLDLALLIVAIGAVCVFIYGVVNFGVFTGG